MERYIQLPLSPPEGMGPAAEAVDVEYGTFAMVEMCFRVVKVVTVD